MLIGYARISKADGSQSLDPLIAAGVDTRRLYSDRASGKTDERPGLEACLKATSSSSGSSTGWAAACITWRRP